MLKEIDNKHFANGSVYCLRTDDGFLIETTETFLPYYTKDCINERIGQLHSNKLTDTNISNRKERWMIGVSCMSGCPVRCKFCATGKMKGWRNLTIDEIVEQVDLMLDKNPEYNFAEAKEHKINYTRMGEPFLNIDNVRKAIEIIDKRYPNTHHYISTIGIKGSDYSFIKDNITLQFSVHSTNEKYRDWLIPYNRKMTLEEIGKVRTKSNLKTTVNMTLVDTSDFDINVFKRNFPSEFFFVKLSPINENSISEKNKLGKGVIKQTNLV